MIPLFTGDFLKPPQGPNSENILLGSVLYMKCAQKKQRDIIKSRSAELHVCE